MAFLFVPFALIALLPGALPAVVASQSMFHVSAPLCTMRAALAARYGMRC
jgi:hypothetical protein